MFHKNFKKLFLIEKLFFVVVYLLSAVLSIVPWCHATIPICSALLCLVLGITVVPFALSQPSLLLNYVVGYLIILLVLLGLGAYWSVRFEPMMVYDFSEEEERFDNLPWWKKLVCLSCQTRREILEIAGVLIIVTIALSWHFQQLYNVPSQLTCITGYALTAVCAEVLSWCRKYFIKYLSIGII